MDKKSNAYKKWVGSDDYKKRKSDHELITPDCPYVIKLDCIGHVQKRAGTPLHELRKNSGKLKEGLPVGGREHRLTNNSIDKLQSN